MKKTIGLTFLLLTTVIGIFFLESDKNQVTLVDGTNTPFLAELSYDMGELEILPWYDDETGIWYVFFPGYIDSETIDCGGLKQGDLYVNGEKVGRQFTWQDDTLYDFVYGGNAMQVIFLSDKNLSTLFIETKSGSNDFIREAKENTEEGYLVSLDHRGNMEYGGKLNISGHGNAWQYYDKRAYDIRLNNKANLAGVDGGSHWKLLHLSNDGDKIHSKLAYDIAEILQADYVPQCNWVNVYLNGEYHGMYLLATAVRDQEVFKSDNIIFLEKDLSDRYGIEEHVISQEGNGFTIHRPKAVTEERKAEILDMVQTVENSIAQGNLDEKLIDVDSFVTQYLIEEITLNSDGFETSAFLYQLTDNAPLCAGPPWDYDACFGEALHMDTNLTDPEESVLNGEPTELTWYQKLYDNPEFLELVIAKYESVMPQLKELYTETIDLYADYIEESVRNDYVRWKGNFKTAPRTGNYQSWETNLRYLKYFCMNRYDALMEKWDIESETFDWTGNGEQHTVRLLYDGREEEITVADGETLDLKEISEFYRQDGCVAKIEYSEEEYSKFLPVLEDFAVKLELVPEVGMTEEYKYVDIPVNMFAERYSCVSVFAIDSMGNTETILSAEPFAEDIHLEYAKEESGMIAVYVFTDETAGTVLKEITISY